MDASHDWLQIIDRPFSKQEPKVSGMVSSSLEQKVK